MLWELKDACARVSQWRVSARAQVFRLKRLIHVYIRSTPLQSGSLVRVPVMVVQQPVPASGSASSPPWGRPYRKPSLRLVRKKKKKEKWEKTVLLTKIFCLVLTSGLFFQFHKMWHETKQISRCTCHQEFKTFLPVGVLQQTPSLLRWTCWPSRLFNQEPATCLM